MMVWNSFFVSFIPPPTENLFVCNCKTLTSRREVGRGKLCTKIIIDECWRRLINEKRDFHMWSFFCFVNSFQEIIQYYWAIKHKRRMENKREKCNATGIRNKFTSCKTWFLACFPSLTCVSPLVLMNILCDVSRTPVHTKTI